MTRPDHDLATRTAHARLRFRHGSAHLPRARGERDRREHGAVRGGPARARPGRERDRPAQAQGRGRRARVPPRGPVRGRTSSSAATRTAAASPASPPPSPMPRTRRWSCSATRSIRPGSPSGPTRGSPTGRPSACPVLLLSGECDPFARIDLLRAAVPRLRERRAGHVPAPRPHAEAGPRRRAGPRRGLPGTHRSGVTRALPAGDRRGSLRPPPGADTVRPCPAARPPSECPDRGPKPCVRSDPTAAARRAHRVVPVGRSRIASPESSAVQARPHRHAGDGHPARRGRPGRDLRQGSARPRPVHERDRQGRIRRSLHRPEPVLGRLRQVPDHAVELAGLGQARTWATRSAKQTPANQERVAAGQVHDACTRGSDAWRRVAYWWLTGSIATTRLVAPTRKAYVDKVMTRLQDARLADADGRPDQPTKPKPA